MGTANPRGVLYRNAAGRARRTCRTGWPKGPWAWVPATAPWNCRAPLDDAEFGDHAHWTFWCPVEFPDRIRISWEFLPLEEPGLAMLFFAAAGQGGPDLFSPDLARRAPAIYPQYHSGDIDALHVSYFRHKYASERAFRTCNLRKSAGFELVAQGADPLPPAEDAGGLLPPGSGQGRPAGGLCHQRAAPVRVDGLLGQGPRRRPYLGFRQMAPLRAAYRNLVVEKLR